MNWLKFLNAIRPELIAFARMLFALYKGDAERSKQHIRRVCDYGVDLDKGRLDNDAELAALRKGP